MRVPTTFEGEPIRCYDCKQVLDGRRPWYGDANATSGEAAPRHGSTEMCLREIGEVVNRLAGLVAAEAIGLGPWS